MRRPWFDNPIYTREMRAWRRMRIARRLVLTIEIALLAAIAISLHSLWRDIHFWRHRLSDAIDLTMYIIFQAELIAAILLPAIIAPATIARERTSGILDDLVVTGVTPAQYVMGKFAAVCVRVGAYMCCLLGLIIVCLVIGWRTWSGDLSIVIVVQLILFTAAWLFCALGVSLGARLPWAGATGAIFGLVAFYGIIVTPMFIPADGTALSHIGDNYAGSVGVALIMSCVLAGAALAIVASQCCARSRAPALRVAPWALFALYIVYLLFIVPISRDGIPPVMDPSAVVSALIHDVHFGCWRPGADLIAGLLAGPITYLVWAAIALGLATSRLRRKWWCGR